MRVRELMTKDPEGCVSEDSCAAAIGIMQRRDCGFVPVLDGQNTKRVIGVVTDRDVALHLGRADRPAKEVSVSSCMTHGPKTVSPDASLEEAVRVMEEAAIHRLPVVEGEKLVGVLSLKDIAAVAQRESRSPGAHPTERKLAELVESIATSR